MIKGSKMSEESREKMRQAKLGHIPWNKGIPHSQKVKEKISKSSKGKHFSPKSEFKKGVVPWNKGKKQPEISNNKHWNWKGDNVGVKGVHVWVKKHKGKPQICVNCGATCKERVIHWSNIDHKWLRNLDDYAGRCCPCHRKYDFKHIFS